MITRLPEQTGAVIRALSALLDAANLAPEDDPNRYDAWRALALSARTEHDALVKALRAARSSPSEEDAEALWEEIRGLREKWGDHVQRQSRPLGATYADGVTDGVGACLADLRSALSAWRSRSGPGAHNATKEE